MALKNAFITLIDKLPANPLFYRFCRRYVNRYQGENNCDIFTNGEFRWMREVLPECEVIFDVGANIGDWAALALEINPTLQIHCFEPCSATYQSLKSRGFSESVILNQLGLSATPGEMNLHVFEKCAGTNSLYRREGLNIAQMQTAD